MRLVLVHGFTQTGRSWGAMADRPHATALDVVPCDDLWATAEAIGVAGGPAIYVGYSMGGRLCLHLALARPDLVEGLVLIGATAGIDADDERAARRAADEELATEIEANGVDAFLDDWLAQPLFATLSPEQAGLAARQRDPAVLTASLRRLGVGTQEPLWDRLHALEMPVLCAAGERDEKFTALAHRLAASIGANASVSIIEGAGHAAHLERPDLFGRLLHRFVVGSAPGQPDH